MSLARRSSKVPGSDERPGLLVTEQTVQYHFVVGLDLLHCTPYIGQSTQRRRSSSAELALWSDVGSWSER